MGNDTYLGNSDVIKKLDDLSAAVGGTTVPTTTTKTNTDFVIGINKSIDAASGRTGVEYPPYSHNTLVTDKLDELAEAIAEGGGGGPGPTPVMGAISVTENGDYLPASYNYDGFSSVSVDVPEPPTPVMGTLSVTENGDYLPSSYNYDGFSSVSVDVETGGGYSETLTILFDSDMETESWSCVSYDGTESFSGTVDSTLETEVVLTKANADYTITCAGISAVYKTGGSATFDFVKAAKVSNAIKNLAMTSNNYTNSDGFTFIASASSERFPAYNAFNGSQGSEASNWWRPDGGYVGGWLQLELPANCKILEHTIYMHYDSGCTTVILFQGSNDGTNFDTIETVDFGTKPSGGEYSETVTVSLNTSYKYYRWYYQTNTGWTGCYVKEITFTSVIADESTNALVTILQGGVISTTSAYARATFSDVSDFEYLMVRISTGGYTDYEMFKVSDIPADGYIDFSVSLHRTVDCRISRTYIESTNYSGSWVNITADIVACTGNMFV